MQVDYDDWQELSSLLDMAIKNPSTRLKKYLWNHDEVKSGISDGKLDLTPNQKRKFIKYNYLVFDFPPPKKGIVNCLDEIIIELQEIKTRQINFEENLSKIEKNLSNLVDEFREYRDIVL